MTKIHVVARMKIHEGKLADFKKGADQCIASTKTEPGAQLYDWFIDEENLKCTAVETYADSEATLAHSANVQAPLSKLLEISDFSGEVFGDATPELVAALAGMNIVPVPFYNGL